MFEAKDGLCVCIVDVLLVVYVAVASLFLTCNFPCLVFVYGPYLELNMLCA